MAVLPTLFSPALGIGLRDSCLLSGDLRVAVRTVGLFPFPNGIDLASAVVASAWLRRGFDAALPRLRDFSKWLRGLIHRGEPFQHLLRRCSSQRFLAGHPPSVRKTAGAGCLARRSAAERVELLSSRFASGWAAASKQ
jgi:hypothetical protein